MTEYGLKERVAVLTINRDGLADKLVERLVEEGCLLAILDHGEIQGKKLDEKIRRQGGTSILKQVDLTNKKAVGECFEAIWDYYGHLDFLVNAAEIHNSLSFLVEISTEQWNQVLQLNLKGTFLACQEAVKFMRAQKFGRIINLSSTVSLDFPPCYGAYAISKLGINALTEVLAKEEAKHNIRVNAVALGSVSTDPSALYSKENSELEKTILSHIPLKRHGNKEEVIETILFLISDESDYITGQIVTVSGGMQMPMPGLGLC